MDEEKNTVGSLSLLADTNLFFEFKKLIDLPWVELNADPIAILVSKPVLDEIDKHKKENGRTRDRALEIFKMLRSSLKAGEADTVIQEASPRVVLRHIGSIRPDDELRDQLEFQKNDDRLVGILSTLIKQGKAENIELFTDDTGPVSTAQGLGLPFRFIDDDWRRPPEQTGDKKRIKALEKDLATYRSQEPSIEIRYGEAIEDGAVRVVRLIAKPLTASELESAIEKLKSRHPLQRDFTPPPSRTIRNPLSGAKTEYKYEAPSQEDIDQYRNVAYPNWLEECKATFRKLSEQLSAPEEKAYVCWVISNVGTRPANHVRIEFKAEGPIDLVRTRNDDDEEEEESSSEIALPKAKITLSSPPQIPDFKEIKKEITPPKPVSAASLDIAKLNTVGSALKDLNTGSAALRAAQASLVGPLSAANSLRSFPNSPMQRVLKDQQRLSDLMNPPHLKAATAFARPTFETVMPRIDHNALRLPEHDPEAFYFDEWKAGIPVQKGALTCDLWRHQKEKRIFEYEVVFSKDNSAKGAVLCTVHAENLTKPASLRIPVIRTIEEFSVFEEAIALIDAL